MTVSDLAERMQVSVRTAHRSVAGWFACQSDPRVPRVVVLRTGRRGRPRYVVDADSFERWYVPALTQAA